MLTDITLDLAISLVSKVTSIAPHLSTQKSTRSNGLLIGGTSISNPEMNITSHANTRGFGTKTDTKRDRKLVVSYRAVTIASSTSMATSKPLDISLTGSGNSQSSLRSKIDSENGFRQSGKSSLDILAC